MLEVVHKILEDYYFEAMNPPEHVCTETQDHCLCVAMDYCEDKNIPASWMSCVKCQTLIGVTPDCWCTIAARQRNDRSNWF